MLIDTTYNPDVLSCLANLSNDEVFTPPEVANQALDLLPQELWSDANSTFLDPVCKSGVFLREIAKRLNDGLVDQIPDLQQRINHIFQNQLYGIGITNITALLSRRSVYCSMDASSQYSVAEGLTGGQGNIIFKRIEHDWVGGKCKFCGASEKEYERDQALESHAYQFIHTNHPEDIFDMKFDVIIGNPPYQLNDGGHGRSAGPIYNLFVDQARRLLPKHIVLIIPNRWYAGGKGLVRFRESMMADQQIRKIIDFESANDIFPGADVPGGICIFHWEQGTTGRTSIINMRDDQQSRSDRVLDEFPVLIADNKAVGIVRRILKEERLSMADVVSSRKPFGFSTNDRPTRTGDLKLRWQKGIGPIWRETVSTGKDMIDRWKLITSKASYDHGGQPDKQGMRKVLSVLEILPPGTICTETYLVVDSFDSEEEAKRLKNYLSTRIVRFLVAQMMVSQDVTKERFRFVPVPDLRNDWNEAKVNSWLGLNQEEVDYVESRIRTLE